MPIAIDWPEVIYAERESVLGVKLGGSATELEFYRVSIDLDSPTQDGPLRFWLFGESAEAVFELKLPGDVARITDYRFIEIGRRSSLKRNSTELDMVEFFEENPPVFWFADGSSLEGNQLVKLRSTIAPFNRERIQALDWSSTDIRKESQLRELGT